MATSFNFQDFLAGLEDIGFYEVALPFLLVFTITFAILQKIKIFGPTGKNFNAVIAVVMAFLVVRTLLLIGILLNKENTSFTGALGGIGILLTLAGVVFAFITSSGALGWEIPSWLNFYSGDWNFIIGLGIFFLFFMYITSESDKDKKNPLWNWIKELPGDIGGKP